MKGKKRRGSYINTIQIGAYRYKIYKSSAKKDDYLKKHNASAYIDFVNKEIILDEKDSKDKDSMELMLLHEVLHGALDCVMPSIGGNEKYIRPLAHILLPTLREIHQKGLLKLKL